MPCRSDHMEQRPEEKDRQQAANFLVYIHRCQQTPVPHWITVASKETYPTSDEAVIELCTVLTDMATRVRENIVYNSHDKTARALADWWEDHLAADQRRDKQEQALRRKKTLRKLALAKLTKDEKEALGIR